MRKLLFLLLVSIFLLSACSSDDESSTTEKTDDKEQEEVQEKVDEEEEQTAEELEEDKLTEVGQVIKDKELKATVELMKIIETNDTIDLDPIKITLEDIKIINMSDIRNSEFKSYLSQFTDKEEFNYFQINYSMENTSDDDVELHSPIDYIVLDSGEQIDVMMEDVALDHDNGGQFFGKVTKESGVFVIIDNSKVEDIESIKLITGDVWEVDGEQVTDRVEKEYTFD